MNTANPSGTETIYALSTPPGRSGVAVVRLSGPQCSSTVEQMTGRPLPPPRRAQLTQLKDSSGDTLDTALVLWFPGPYSFTGEDMAELHVHGSRAVIHSLFDTFRQNERIRPAQPGEFSRRALLNGKMDLLEVEALSDLIDAETNQQRKQALRFMDGSAGEAYRNLRNDVLHALAYLEALIDFPDEDIPPSVAEQVEQTVAHVRETLRAMLADNRAAERIREGFSIVILGAPNAGKSTFLNTLAKRPAAIVSPMPGTTRDIIELPFDIGGYAVTLVDTAGLRETDNDIEQEGIRRAMEHARLADVVLHLYEPGQIPTGQDFESHVVYVCTKADSGTAYPIPSGHFAISAHTGIGMEPLLSHIRSLLDAQISQQSSYIFRERHRVELTRAYHYITQFDLAKPLELCCEDLRCCAAAIGNVTGTILTEEVLGRIFSSFCIGK